MKLHKEIFNFSIGTLIQVLCTTIMTPIILRNTTIELFGEITFYYMIYNLLAVFCMFGLEQGFNRFYYEQYNKKDLLYKCMKNSIIVYVVLLLSYFSLYAPFFKANKILNNNYFWILLLMELIYRYRLNIYRIQGEGKKYSLYQVLPKLIENSIILLVIFYYEISLETIIISTTIALIITNIILEIKKNKLKDQEIIKIKEKELLKFSIPILFTMIITWCFQAVDRIMIKEITTYEQLGIYSAAYKIVGFLVIFQTIFGNLWVSKSYEQYIKDELKSKKFFSLTFERMSMFFIIIYSFLMLIKKLIEIYLGKNYNNNFILISILIIVPILHTLSDIVGVGINFKKKTKYNIYISLVVSLLNISGNWILIPIYGALGAAISTALSYCIYFILRTLISLKVFYFQVNLKYLVYLLLIVIINIYIIFLEKNMIIYLFNMGVELIIFIYIYLKVKENKTNEKN